MGADPTRRQVEGELLDALTAGVVATTADGRITAVNAAACRILGAPEKALLGSEIRSFMADITVLAGEGRGEVRAKGEPSKVYGYSVSSYVDAEQQPRYAILFQEISGFLEVRRQRDRLLQMAALGDALPCVLHELKNPLTALLTMLEVMIEDPEPPTVTDLHALLTETRRIHLTLQGVGGFTAPLLTERYEAIDLAVQEACRVLEPTAARRGIAISCASRALPLLPIDRNVVSGVVFNLVRNAIDACASGDRVEVDASVVEDGDVFVLRVSDNGPGMTPQIAARCTELFFTSKPTGFGIGLALCKLVADTAGGTLEIRSSTGVGTEATLRLPVRLPKQAGQRTEEACRA